MSLALVVTTHNRPLGLAATLESLRPGYGRLEIIVVNDGDDDYRASDLPVPANSLTYAKIRSRGGPAFGRNIGMQLASAVWVGFLDDDDLLSEQWVTTIVDIAARNERGLFFGNFRRLVGSNHDRRGAVVRAEVDVSTVTIDDLMVGNRIPVGAYILPRADALSYGFDAAMPSHEDWDFLLHHARGLTLRHVNAHSVDVFALASNEAQARNMRAKQFHVLDFLTIYRRYPATTDAIRKARLEVLKSGGVIVSPNAV